MSHGLMCHAGLRICELVNVNLLLWISSLFYLMWILSNCWVIAKTTWWKVIAFWVDYIISFPLPVLSIILGFKCPVFTSFPLTLTRFVEPDPSHTLEERVVHWYFAQLDNNGSHDINKKELKPFKRYLKKKAKPKKCARKFTDYCDLNKDRAISLQELKGCLGVSKEGKRGRGSLGKKWVRVGWQGHGVVSRPWSELKASWENVLIQYKVYFSNLLKVLFGMQTAFSTVIQPLNGCKMDDFK